MSERERWGDRDLTYSNWHREASTSRFLDDDVAHALTMIDLDGLEYCANPACRRAVALVEVARDVGQSKPAYVTARLASDLRIPGLVAFYTPSGRGNGDWPDIDTFRVRTLGRSGESTVTPAAFAQRLARFHAACRCGKGRSGA